MRPPYWDRLEVSAAESSGGIWSGDSRSGFKGRPRGLLEAYQWQIQQLQFSPKDSRWRRKCKEKRNTTNFKIMSWYIFTYIASGQIRVFPIWTSREVLGSRSGERQCQTDGVGHQNWAGIWKVTGCPNSRIAEADGVIGVLRAGHGEINHNVSAQRHQWESVKIKFGTEKVNWQICKEFLFLKFL